MKFWAIYGVTLDNTPTGVHLYPSKKKAWKKAKKTMRRVIAEYENDMTPKDAKNAGIYTIDKENGTLQYANMTYVIEPVKLKKKHLIQKMIYEADPDTTFEITSALTLSTGHISQATSEIIAKECEHNSDRGTEFPVCYEKGPYGFIVHIAPDYDPHDSAIPKDLAQCMNTAALLGCEWLCLDRDGPVTEQLDIYEW